MNTEDRILQALTSDYIATGNETLTINNGGAAVVQTLLSIPLNCRYALCVVEAGVVADSTKVCRFWHSGGTPTASQGFLMGNGGTFDIKGHENIKKFKVLAQDAVNSSIQVQYYK